jgi:hypothetical protein
VSGQQVFGTDADSAPRDMGDDIINTGHGLHGEVCWSANAQPEGFVSSDSVSAHIRAGALHERHQLELFQAGASTAKVLGKSGTISVEEDERVTRPQRFTNRTGPRLPCRL